jgi:peptidoglycan/xylan/chitin deacetylase (PgdA/CDA1 family)
VVFRDDDPQPYWESQALRDLNEVFIEENVPVTHGVVPATENGGHSPNSNFAEYMRELKANHPDLIELSLHGYTHNTDLSDWKGGSEFAGYSYDWQYNRLEQAKDAFENAFGEAPATFIAPGNTYDRTTARALGDLGLIAASGNTLVSSEFGGRTGAFPGEHVYHIMETTGFYTWSENRFRSTAELKQAFLEKIQSSGIYVQMLHYHHFTNQARLDQLRELIQYMKSKNVYFTTLEGLTRGITSGLLEQDGSDWIVHPESTCDEDGTLTDIDGHPFEDAIRTLADQGVVNGYSDCSFRPEQSITRAETSVLLQTAFSLSASENSPTFVDVDADHWARESIRAVADAGLMTGYGGGRFGPDRDISKAELIAALAGGYPSADPAVLDAYADGDEVPSWARNVVAAAHETWNGIPNYPDEDVLDPTADATRAEAAKYVLLAAETDVSVTGSNSAMSDVDSLFRQFGSAE